MEPINLTIHTTPKTSAEIAHGASWDAAYVLTRFKGLNDGQAPMDLVRQTVEYLQAICSELQTRCDSARKQEEWNKVMEERAEEAKRSRTPTSLSSLFADLPEIGE